MENTDKYSLRGVSSSKSEVHKAIKGLGKGLFPNAFCKILPDFVANSEGYCNIMHADTAGTKGALAYLYWKETGDLNVWKGIVQDAIVMNLDDLLCVGATNDIVLSSTIGRNKNLIPAEVLETIIQFTNEYLRSFKEFGINLVLSGGETADVGDIVRTIDVGFTAFTRMKKENIIENNIQDADVIVGLASFGQSTYENFYNSGIGSNGLTNARHELLSKYYQENFPETFDPLLPEEVVYIGKHRLSDEVRESEFENFGQLILSATRSYLPLMNEFLANHRKKVNGMIHCTGGGQTKVMKFVENMRIIKDNLLPTPAIFNYIRESAEMSWREMYQVFNMGHRLEIYTDKSTAHALIAIAKQYNIEAQIIGRCEKSDKNELIVKNGDVEVVW